MVKSVMMKQLYPQMMSDGIMADLSEFSVPWKDVVSSVRLDLGYYWHSAQKLASPILLDISLNTEFSDLSELTHEQRIRVAGTIFEIYSRKWNRLWAAAEMQYNPTNNYTMNETETLDREVGRIGSNTGTVTNVTDGETSNTGTSAHNISDTGTVTNVTDRETTNTGTSAHNITDGGNVTTQITGSTTNTGTQTNAGTNNVLDGIFGFNSDDSVGSNTTDESSNNVRTDDLASSKTESQTETRNTTHVDTRTDNLASTEDNTDTETRNLSKTDTRTDNLSSTEDVTETETRNLSNSETENEDYTRQNNRVGATGIYSPQQLIGQEIELWQWNFFKQVFEDIDDILCLSVY